MEAKLVKIIKLRECEDPLTRAESWETYRAGARDNLGSLPVDYEVIGHLIVPPQPGKGVRMMRYQRNGIWATGVFNSTEVQEVYEWGFRTRNSIYLVEALE